VETKPLRLVPHPEGRDRIAGHRGGGWDLWQRAAVRPPEVERAIGPSVDLVALLVDGAVVPAAEQG
jgi:hypothetical protein